MKDETYGAVVERGTISAITADGYEVKSMDRNGIVAPNITGIHDEAYSVGDRVYFFLFRDGTGRILCRT